MLILLLDKWGIGYVEVSAKRGINVDQTFIVVIHMIDEFRKKPPNIAPQKKKKESKVTQ